MHYRDSIEQDVLSWPKKKLTLINLEFIVNMIGFLLLLLEYALGGLDIFIFEAMVLCDVS
jgi:hypothetical protein